MWVIQEYILFLFFIYCFFCCCDKRRTMQWKLRRLFSVPSSQWCGSLRGEEPSVVDPRGVKLSWDCDCLSYIRGFKFPSQGVLTGCETSGQRLSSKGLMGVEDRMNRCLVSKGVGWDTQTVKRSHRISWVFSWNDNSQIIFFYVESLSVYFSTDSILYSLPRASEVREVPTRWEGPGGVQLFRPSRGLCQKNPKIPPR